MDPIYERPQDYDLEHEGDEKDIRFYERLVKRLARGARSSWRRAAAASRFGWRGSPAGSVGPQRRARHLAAVPQVVGGVNRRHPALSGLAADAMGRGEGGMRSVYVSIDI